MPSTAYNRVANQLGGIILDVYWRSELPRSNQNQAVDSQNWPRSSKRPIRSFNPYMNNGLSYLYNLDESTVCFKGHQEKLFIFISFSVNKYADKPQMGRRVLRRHSWGYDVCLYPIKGRQACIGCMGDMDAC